MCGWLRIWNSPFISLTNLVFTFICPLLVFFSIYFFFISFDSSALFLVYFQLQLSMSRSDNFDNNLQCKILHRCFLLLWILNSNVCFFFFFFTLNTYILDGVLLCVPISSVFSYFYHRTDIRKRKWIETFVIRRNTNDYLFVQIQVIVKLFIFRMKSKEKIHYETHWVWRKLMIQGRRKTEMNLFFFVYKSFACERKKRLFAIETKMIEWSYLLSTLAKGNTTHFRLLSTVSSVPSKRYSFLSNN